MHPNIICFWEALWPCWHINCYRLFAKGQIGSTSSPARSPEFPLLILLPMLFWPYIYSTRKPVERLVPDCIIASQRGFLAIAINKGVFFVRIILYHVRHILSIVSFNYLEDSLCIIVWFLHESKYSKTRWQGKCTLTWPFCFARNWEECSELWKSINQALQSCFLSLEFWYVLYLVPVTI